mgnify:CR=1 FL=1
MLRPHTRRRKGVGSPSLDAADQVFVRVPCQVPCQVACKAGGLAAPLAPGYFGNLKAFSFIQQSSQV